MNSLRHARKIHIVSLGALLLTMVGCGAGVEQDSSFGSVSSAIKSTRKKAQTDLREKLRQAARNGDPSRVSVLLQRGANVNAVDIQGLTPLHWAARYGHSRTVEALLEGGADVNVENERGVTPLHLAARYGHSGTVKVLLEGGAHVDAATGDGDTALHLAALFGHLEAVTALLAANPYVNALDMSTGNTPLHAAVKGCRWDCAQALMQVGADATLTDKLGLTPKQHAWIMAQGTEAQETVFQLFGNLDEEDQKKMMHLSKQTIQQPSH